MRQHSIVAAAGLLAFAAAACAGARETVTAEHTHDSTTATATVVIPPGATYNEADVKFMQGMIPHHGQAVAMTSLAVRRNASPALIRFAQKMDLAQRAEIELMQSWLKERNQAVPDSSSHHHVSMPGMLTAEQFKELEAASGRDFDRLFLTLMIQHHEGALQMVAELFDTPSAAQEPDVWRLATDIDIDQRAEIERMREMLENL